MDYMNRYLPPTDISLNFQPYDSDIVREYCKLGSQKDLSDADADRMQEILQLAESDGWLDFWLSEADHFLAHELGLTNEASTYNFENQQAKLREYLEHQISENYESQLFENLTQQVRIAAQELQQHLKNRGFDPGPVDGVLGSRTHSALVAFQRAHQLVPDGVPGATTREALGLN